VTESILGRCSYRVTESILVNGLTSIPEYTGKWTESILGEKMSLKKAMDDWMEANSKGEATHLKPPKHKYRGGHYRGKYHHWNKKAKRRKKKKPKRDLREIERLKKLPYDKYLQSAWWQKIRKQALNYAGNRCQICNSDGKLDVHHRTYDRRGNEKQSDLTVLCRECHSKFHDKLHT